MESKINIERHLPAFDAFIDNPLLPLKSALEVLGAIPYSTALGLIKKGHIHTTRIGHKHFVSLAEISRLRSGGN